MFATVKLGANPFMTQPEAVQSTVDPMPTPEPFVSEMPNINPQPQMAEPNVMPTVETPVVETPQDLGFNMDFRNITPETNTAPVENVTPMVEPAVEQPVPAMSQPEPVTMVTPEPTTSTVNVRQAIEILRNTSSQLESLGFKVDVEEYDLENMYQMIFKINK